MHYLSMDAKSYSHWVSGYWLLRAMGGGYIIYLSA